jgi:S-adenosylhomocysteine hydrolase
MMHKIKSSLGPELVKRGEHWEIDLSGLRVFFGLSVLAHILCDDILNRLESAVGDVSFLYKINPGINPELYDMNIFHIQVNARAGILLPEYVRREEFRGHLRTVLGTLQMPSWMGSLHPEAEGKSHESKALVFPFHVASDHQYVNYQFIMERLKNSWAMREYFLRLTIENDRKAGINLESIPHVIVDDIRNRTYIEGSSRISGSLTNNIHSACHRGTFVYSEENRLNNQLFEQIAKTRLGSLDCINVYWDPAFSDLIMRSKPEQILPESKKLLLCLESDEICRLLAAGETIKVILKNTVVFLDLSRRYRVLNYSFNEKRKKTGMDFYLRRMPELEAVSGQRTRALDFRGVDIFLVHHITSEIISLIEALFRKKARRIWVSFVKYSGTVPPGYLDILLDVPQDSLFMASLDRNRNKENVLYYSLSNQFSDMDSMDDVRSMLEKKRLDYFEAMQLLAGNMFLKFCMDSYRERRRVLLIEDGGYIAPYLNKFISQGKTLNQVFSAFGIEPAGKDVPFQKWLSGILVGTVEHTRNGFDRLLQFEKKYGSFFPSFSIAISKKKVNEESKEVARSILNAVESILYGQGLTLSGRKTMVIGAAGNIGRFLCEKYPRDKTRIQEKNIIKIDVCYRGNADFEYHDIDGVPSASFLETDLFIGLVGKSVLTGKHLEKLLLKGKNPRIFFASGSTKTLEYADVIEYIKTLSTAAGPRIGGHPADVQFDRINDPQTGLDQGGRVVIDISMGRKHIRRTLFLLGDLSPINFLYYGVPAESMDAIMSQLARLSLGVIGRYRNKTIPKSGIYAVDREIDEWGRPLPAAGGEKNKVKKNKD